MKMIFHILLKDLRRHWPEIVGFVLVCGIWGWGESHPSTMLWVPQRGLLQTLFFGLWILITVRLVQGECMVGDREFWPTRPYRWPRLMAAKALALVLCLNLPLLAVEFYLLHHAHIPFNWALIPLLLILQGVFILILTFPVAVLASITGSIVQWVVTVVGLILAIMTLTWIPWDKLPPGLSGGEEVSTWIGFGILVPVMLLVLVWQFARHRETPARWLLGLSLLSIPLCIFLSSTFMVRSIAYPLPKASNPMQLILADDGSGKWEFRRTRTGERWRVDFTVVDRAFDSDSIIKVDGYRAELSGPGWHWQSKWVNQTTTMTHAFPGFGVNVEIPEDIADKVAQGDATAKVEVAFETYRLDRAQAVDTKPSQFLVPGVGQCEWPDGRSERVLIRGSLMNGESCVAPLRLPAVWVTEIDSAGDACPLRTGEPPVPPGHFTLNVEYGNSGIPVEFDPNPVREFRLASSAWNPPVPDYFSPKENRTASVCRGTRFTVRTGRAVETLRATYDLGALGNEKPVDKNDQEDDKDE
jgi:hypothetical protein